MAVSGKMKCTFRKIYPVRYALTSEPEDQLPMKKQPQLGKGLEPFKVKVAAGSILSRTFSYNHTLRTLREGYVHIYLHKSGERRTYQTNGAKFRWVGNLKESESATSVKTGSSYKPWIALHRDETLISINFSEVAWSSEHWNEIIHNAALRNERMQKIVLDNSGAQDHTAPIAKAVQLVEEHRKKTGWLHSLSEHLPKLFNPDLDHTQMADPEVDVPMAWRHSLAPIGRVKKDDGEEEYQYSPYQKDTPHRPDPADFKTDQILNCDVRPLLVALYDPLGQAGDLAQINLDNIQAQEDYSRWYSHPVTIARYLNVLEESMIAEQQRRWPVNPMRWRLALSESRIPESGWKTFMRRFDFMDRVFNAYFTAFAGSWRAWLAQAGPNSILSAFKDFEDEHWKEKEKAFDRSHFALTVHPAFVPLALALYVGKEALAATKNLLADVLTAKGNPVSDYTDNVLSAFTLAFVQRIKNGQDPLGHLDDIVQNRLNVSGAQLDPVAATTLGGLLESLRRNMDESSLPGGLTALSALLETPAKNAFTLYKTYKKHAHKDISPTNLYKSVDPVARLKKVSARFNALHAVYKLFTATKKIITADKVALSDLKALFSAVSGVAVLALGACSALAGKIFTKTIWTAFMVVELAKDLGNRDHITALLGASYLIVSSVVMFFGIANAGLAAMGGSATLGGGLVPVLNVIGIILLLCYVFFKRQALELWMDSCYWSPTSAPKYGKSWGQWDFNYKEFDTFVLQEREARLRADAAGLLKLMCTPVPEVCLVATDKFGVDYFVVEVMENLFNPRKGVITLDFDILFSRPMTTVRSPDQYITPVPRGSGFMESAEVERVRISFAGLLAKKCIVQATLDHSETDLGAAVAAFYIDRQRLNQVFDEYFGKDAIPLSIHEREDWKVDIRSEYSDESGTYRADTIIRTIAGTHREAPPWLKPGFQG